MYKPDYWKILKITHDGKSVYKLLAHWLGSFAESNEWRLNSGITKVEFNPNTNCYEIHGESGSIYNCSATGEHISGFMIGTIDGFMYRLKDTDATIVPISMEDFLNENWNR